MTATAQHLSAADFDEVVSSATAPVLVDFYADWCGPCKVLAPVVEELAAEYADRVDVRKVDVEAEPQLAERFGIRSIPTLMLFKDGEARETLLGAVAKPQLAAVLDQHSS